MTPGSKGTKGETTERQNHKRSRCRSEVQSHPWEVPRILYHPFYPHHPSIILILHHSHPLSSSSFFTLIFNHPHPPSLSSFIILILFHHPLSSSSCIILIVYHPYPLSSSHLSSSSSSSVCSSCSSSSSSSASSKMCWTGAPREWNRDLFFRGFLEGRGAERLCLLDPEPTQAPPGHVVIHDNLTNRAALPTMRHSSFWPISFRRYRALAYRDNDG